MKIILDTNNETKPEFPDYLSHLPVEALLRMFWDAKTQDGSEPEDHVPYSVYNVLLQLPKYISAYCNVHGQVVKNSYDGSDGDFGLEFMNFHYEDLLTEYWQAHTGNDEPFDNLPDFWVNAYGMFNNYMRTYNTRSAKHFRHNLVFYGL